jgi:acyl carrier protein
MTRGEIWDHLVAAIREEIDAPGAVIEPQMTAGDVPGWDSLAHVRIVMNVEDRTGAVITVKDTYAAATVGELCDIVERAARKAG